MHDSRQAGEEDEMSTRVLFRRFMLVIGSLVMVAGVCASFAAAMGDTSFQWFAETWGEAVLFLGLAVVTAVVTWRNVESGRSRLVLALGLTVVGLSAVVGQYYQPFFHVTRWSAFCMFVISLVMYMRSLLYLWKSEDEELAHKS